MGLSGTDPDTGAFYDRWTELFLAGSGPVFQAGILRTGDPPREVPEHSVVVLAERAGLRDGDRVLDAGCGVAGPATIIAHHFPAVVVDCVTNSYRQAAIARRRIVEVGLEDRVRVHLADYQILPFRSARFDKVLFLESTGYATDLVATYREAHRVLEPGGSVYVKDVFTKVGPLSADETSALERFDRHWGCIRTKTIPETTSAMAAAGLEAVHAATMSDIGTARLVGTMLSITEDGIDLTELGRSFLDFGVGGPIEFAEILAVKTN